VFKQLVILWLALMLLSGVVMAWQSQWGISLLWGFSVCLLPAMVFAKYAGQIRGALAVGQSVNRFYRAESAKLILTALLFAAVFIRDELISMPVFLCAFVAAQIAQIILVALSVYRYTPSGRR
jgi:ATP synthase protein I